MSGWHAVVPIKPVADRKLRLRRHVSDSDVEHLTEKMLRHVSTVLRSISAVADVTLLAEHPHPEWPTDWFADHRAGLNAALCDVARSIPHQLLIVHADLPDLAASDVEMLIAAASSGAAIAPDRHGVGTNALALTVAAGFPFAFGPDSFVRHRALLPDAAIVTRQGLALDIDRPADLALIGSVKP